ncbi:MAG: ATP-grasp domain-containing protein, partial [Alphaproteobacteria bacterium]|nr:ATP-grasp domain-containing protein [Alphaproteobacteria bacterium]
MFDKVLVANRGEIACRVFSTARRLGMRGVAVYSDADAEARHVAMADEAYRIGPAPARESYLKIEAIIEAAKRSGAKAVHPGYGFLSENAAFAEACAAADLVFVGPPPHALLAMGSKSAAKDVAVKAGVPVLPGYHGESQDPAQLAVEAKRIGFPVLIKAIMGGGGKGMRTVTSADAFAAAFEGARREGEASFGDGRVLIEKFVGRPRHVEIQIFADRFGNVVHLFERDCSLQRRHQKVLEEAPAPNLPPATRHGLQEAAVALAQAIGYVGAGTVEFLVDADDPSRFYFMEVNARLQVEHPVTEMIVGEDLVEWQFRVAAGERLPKSQSEIRADGHAFEVRLYAEDPERGYLPSTGRLTVLDLPATAAQLRVDSGVVEGDVITPYYDPMIAKLIVRGETRDAALRRLRSALAEVHVVGPANNVAFLRQVAAHPDFAAIDLDTGFLTRHRAALIPESGQAPDDALAFAAVEVLIRRREAAAAFAARSADPFSPFNSVEGWALNDDGHDEIRFADGERAVVIPVAYRGAGWELALPGGKIAARGDRDPSGGIAVDLDGRRVAGRVAIDGRNMTVSLADRAWRFQLEDPLDVAGADEAAAGDAVVAPMTGKIVKVLVRPGE